MRLLGIDYGEKRIGLAVGDTETKLALPRQTIKNSGSEVIIQLKKIIIDDDIETVVIGEPLSLLGLGTSQTEYTKSFVAQLKAQLEVPVVLIDERFTSQRADSSALGVNARGRDELAAMYLLQDYLDRLSQV